MPTSRARWALSRSPWRQDPTAVDTVSGATVAHSQFLQASLRAVYQAQGVADDGRADTVAMPGLGLEDEDY